MPNSNWGAAGQFRQENTQFFGDLRGYDFSGQEEAFPLTPRAFFQKNGLTAGTGFSQGTINLFQLDLDRDDAYADSSLVGAEMTDSATADLDGDGQEDLVSIDGGTEAPLLVAGPGRRDVRARRSGGPWPATRR